VDDYQSPRRHPCSGHLGSLLLLHAWLLCQEADGSLSPTIQTLTPLPRLHLLTIIVSTERLK